MSNQAKKQPLEISTIMMKFIIGIFVTAEIFLIVFIFIYWKDLQNPITVKAGNSIEDFAFQNSIVLGYVRAFLILLIPVILFLLATIGVKILFSSTIKIGGVNLSSLAENLEQSENSLEKFEKLINQVRELKEENNRIEERNKILAKSYVNEILKSSKRRR